MSIYGNPVMMGGSGGGGGGGGIPTLLSYSDPNDILANSYYTDFYGTSWGNLSVTGTPTTHDMGIKTASGNGFSLDLGADNTDATIYAIVRGYENGDKFPLGFSYALSSGNTIAYMTRNGIWFAGVWGSDTGSDIAYNTPAVLTIAVDCTAKRAYFYINGTALTDKSFINCGRTARFNGSTSFSDRAGEFDYLFAGVVAGCESSATVIANQQDMLDVLTNGRILIPV